MLALLLMVSELLQPEEFEQLAFDFGVELDDVDEIFFDEFVGERNGIIDEHADTQNFRLERSEEFLREFGWAVAF